MIMYFPTTYYEIKHVSINTSSMYISNSVKNDRTSIFQNKMKFIIQISTSLTNKQAENLWL